MMKLPVIVVAVLLSAACPGIADEKEPAEGAAAGRLILGDASVWRAYITWMPAVARGTNGVVAPTRVYRGLKQSSAMPPQDWITPDFDDSSWFYWREPRVSRTLKINKTGARNPKPEDFEDTGLPAYDAGQYGIQRSVFMGLRCFRARFMVEDPGKVQDLTLYACFRGGLLAYLNGVEIGRASLPVEGAVPSDAAADDYPNEAEVAADGKKTLEQIPGDPENLKRINTRVRSLQAKIPGAALRKGVNVLALEIHRAPLKKVEWNACGLVTVELRGSGAILQAVTRPKGVQVWNANALTRITPYGGLAFGRIWAGGEVFLQSFPLSWGCPFAPLVPVRIAGARNGVFTGQIVVSSDEPIRSLEAKAGDLVQTDGGGRIPAAAVQLCFQGYPDAYPKSLTRDPNMSLFDVLYEKAPAEVSVRTGDNGGDGAPSRGTDFVAGWTDGGAVVPIWLRVRVPANVPAGAYQGKVSIRTAKSEETAVPVHLKVADWTLPVPKEFVTHVGAMHSPDTLAVYYNVPPWSDEHFKLMEKTFAYTSELGGKVAFIPLVVQATWLKNERSMVSWVKEDSPAGNSYKYDFQLFERYMDLIQKYLKPEVVCLYVTDGSGMCSIKGVTALDLPGGKAGILTLPPYEPKPESVAFWKPVIAEARERLAKRGLADTVTLGLLWEQNAGDKGKAAVELFKAAAPGLKLTQIAHYGGQKGENNGVPYGYVMSVWGNNTPQKSKVYGARDLSVKVAWHPRADAFNDIRPIAPWGAFRTVMERAAAGTIGLSPVGMDFWNLAKTGALEGAGAWNLGMASQTAGAFLAPGPDGPLSTVRFEMLRESLQECEARQVIEKALADPATREKLGEAVVKRCREVLDDREAWKSFCERGEGHAEGEGWQWFAGTNWEERGFKLFNCAGEIQKAVAAR
ncbi:MAG: hypothetical protein C0404_13420 [Verrucomicrobia bacterium]|nr:hypothetical protein [Verrucomicrobiota bacterium]